MKPCLYLALIMTICGCKREFHDSYQVQFVTVQERSHEVPSRARLAKADAAGIPYGAFTFHGEYTANPRIPEFNRNFLEFRFGPLTRSQFDTLMAAYSQGRSRVQYSAARSDYELDDFLPIPIQAVDKKRLARDRDLPPLLPDRQGKLAIMANCWMTAYEILRKNDREMQTWESNAVGEKVFEVFMNSQFSQRIDPLETEFRQMTDFNQAFEREAIPGLQAIAARGGNDNFNEMSRLLESLFVSGRLPPFPSYGSLARLEFGDLLLVGGLNNPLHAAIYVDKNLFFERTQVGEVVGGGFRLVEWSDILAAYLAFPGQYSFWRVHSPLPPPETFFERDAQGRVPVRSHSFRFDANGRAFFDLRN